MAGEIKLNSVNFASESGGTITINNGTIGSAVAMSANQACVKTALNASGSAPIYACRAWVNFDGTNAFSSNPSTSAIRASGNVSSITDNGTGYYTVNFTTAMPDANYGIAVSRTNETDQWVTEIRIMSQATSSLSVYCVKNGSETDPTIVCASVFR